MTYRELSAQALAETDYDSFLTELERALTNGRKDPNVVVQETLTEIYFGHTNIETAQLSCSGSSGHPHIRPKECNHRARVLLRHRRQALRSSQTADLALADV